MHFIKSVIFTLLSSVFVFLLPLITPAEAAPKLGQPAPGFKVRTTSGQSVDLDSYRGHPLVIDFFATWCRPCRQSIPHLVEMNRKYGQQGLRILGLSADEEGESVLKAFAAEHRINYSLALADDAVAAAFGVRSVPIMFLIDKKGKVAEIYRGFSNEMGRSMEQLIVRLLAEK